MHFEINVRPEAFSVAVPRMASPTEGRFTSGFNLSRYIVYNGKRVFSPHAGIDIAPPTPGDSGRAVYAAFAGKVSHVVHGRYLGQPASSGTVVAPGRSGNGLRVRNPDGEQQIYIHVNAVVKNGQTVKAGQLLGHTDRSGIQTGPHLHFECWNRAGNPYNPAVLFKKYGVGIGSRPAHTPSKNPPKKTPPTPPAPPKDWFDMASEADLRKIVRAEIDRALSTKYSIHGSLKTYTGNNDASLPVMIRYAANSMPDGRNFHADLRARLAGLQAAVHELATTKGIDADKVDAAINKAVKDALSDLKITLTTED